MDAAAFEPYENTEPITVTVTLADYLLNLQEVQAYLRMDFDFFILSQKVGKK